MSRSREEEGGRGEKELVDGGRRIRALERWTGERPTERTEEMMEKSRPSPFDTLPSLHALPPSSLALSRCRRASRTGRRAHSNRAARARMAVGGGKRRDGAPGRAPITSATTPSPLLHHHDLLRLSPHLSSVRRSVFADDRLSAPEPLAPMDQRAHVLVLCSDRALRRWLLCLTLLLCHIG